MAELEILFSDMGALAAICLVVGMICSIIEIFNPGFGFFGITGIVLTLLGMILAVTHTSSGNPVKQFFLLLLLEIIVLTLAFGLMAYSVKKGWISRTALVEKNTAVPEGATEGTPEYKELIEKRAKRSRSCALSEKQKSTTESTTLRRRTDLWIRASG